MADVDISDVLLMIARQVSESLEADQIRLKPGYFSNLFTEISELMQTPIQLAAEAELSVGIARITAKTKDSPKLRSQLRQYLEPRTSNILDAINDEILGRANTALQAKGKKGIVVIVDNLDRIDNSPKPWGRTQPEYLFVDRGEQLKRLNCHVVFTIPLTLMFSNDYDRLSSRFGVKPKVLPMVPVCLRDGTKNPSGMLKLQQMVLARAFPDLPPEDRFQLISTLFDSPETLKSLVLKENFSRRFLIGLYREFWYKEIKLKTQS